MSCLEPLLVAYNNQSYDRLETAIFPKYFHGKCQRNGVDPVGCPDPDCPVVCGTPGSLVHFYSVLRSIAFNQTSKTLSSLATPGSGVYEQVARKLQIAIDDRSNRPRSHPRALSLVRRDSTGFSQDVSPTGLEEILEQIDPLLDKECGGTDYPRCSWETSMKAFILSYQ